MRTYFYSLLRKYLSLFILPGNSVIDASLLIDFSWIFIAAQHYQYLFLFLFLFVFLRDLRVFVMRFRD